MSDNISSPPTTPAPDRKRSRKRVALAAFVVALVGLGVWQLVNLVLPEPIDPAGTGTITIDGVAYPFTPTTCFISEQDFVAAGTGYVDSDQFWVSASSANLDLTVGTHRELERPPSDKPWLENDRSITWRATGERALTAVTQMSDHRTPGADPVTGRLDLSCNV